MVENTATVQQLVSNVLLGEGVEASNITYNYGSAALVRRQVGYFSGAAPYIGLERGIIIATGGVEVAQGPNNIPTAHVTVPADQQLNAESDLSKLIGIANLRDVAIVEFDFQAKGDTLRFRYVFASEEYNDHTCSPYNDAFGFFVSGPGIQGNPNFLNSAKNVALVPGTQVPVAINTINQGFAGMYGANAVCNAAYNGWQANSQYFVNNANNMDPGTTQFDGFTVPLLIEIPVVCGETYHIKLAIADAIDDKNDSAVFIEAESFSSELILETSLEVVHPEEGVDTLAVEGCSTYRLHLHRGNDSREQTVYLRTRQLAHAASILPDLPASVHFAVGETSKTVEFSTVHNSIHEGVRAWRLEALYPQACSQDTAIFAVKAAITDRPPMVIEAPDELFVPCHESVALSVLPSGGNPPYTVHWSAEELDNVWSQEIFAESDTLIVAVVSDVCNLHTVQLNIPVWAEAYTALDIQVPASFEFGCVEPVHLGAAVSGGVGEYTYSWTQGDSVLSVQNQFSKVFNQEDPVVLKVSDRCAEDHAVEIQPILLANPVVVGLGTDTVGTCLDELMLLPEVIGGFGVLSYAWSVNGVVQGTTPIFIMQPTTTVRVILEVRDQCGQSDSDTLYVFVHDDPLKVHLPADTTLCINERLVLRPMVEGAVGGVQYLWPVTGGTLPEYVYIAREPATFAVQVSDGCGRHAAAQTRVHVAEVQAAFAFDYDFPENGIRNLSSGNALYTWTFPDGSTSTESEPVYVPARGTSSAVVLRVSDVHGCEDTAVEFFDPPMDIFIPTAFSPNGDGRNDEFKAVGRYVDSFHMLIYDKWGTLIFESHDIDQSWDGSGTRRDDHLSSDNLYPYLFRARSWSGEVREGRGTVMLLR